MERPGTIFLESIKNIKAYIFKLGSIDRTFIHKTIVLNEDDPTTYQSR